MTAGLPRTVGLTGAILLGLGSIVGTGVFVSLGLGAELASDAVLLAVLIGSLLATFNGLSSAQLAAAHPRSGGTYAYGRRYLSPSWGFLAGSTFLIAKSASAATAALGLSGYILSSFEVSDLLFVRVLSVVLSLVITALGAGGLRRSNHVNTALVLTTLSALVLLVVWGAPAAPPVLHRVWESGLMVKLVDVLHASALMFVAYTGYGRIATLGEEVRDPKRTIAPAILVTLGVTALLYVAVASVAVGVLGAEGLAQATRDHAAPLAAVATGLGQPWLAGFLRFAAVTAMAGVLLNLVLGLSRVLYAMAEDGEAPSVLAQLDAESGSPSRAVWATGFFVAAIAALGSVRAAWSLSAFAVLIYYATTNLAALRLPAEDRSFAPLFSWLGLLGCLSLLPWIDLWSAMLGSLLIALSFVARHLLVKRAL